MGIECLIGGSSREAQLFVYVCQKNGPLPFQEGRPLLPSTQLQEGHAWSGEGRRGPA